MKNTLILFPLMLISLIGFSQVGIDTDNDGVLDSVDVEIHSPYQYRVDSTGKSVSIMWELPKTTNYRCRDGYCFYYSEKEEQSLWVCYMLTASDLQGAAKRNNHFKEDTLIETGSASPNDYKKSGYDKGHLKPAADNKDSQDEMNASFLMSNISPQYPSVNRIVWKGIEDYERALLKSYDSLFIVTGVIFSRHHKKIGKNDVGVPEYFYKCIIAKKDTMYYGCAFLVPNKECEKNIELYRVAIDCIEKRTKNDFFYMLPKEIQLFTEQ